MTPLTPGTQAGAFCLGLWYADGLHGLPVDEAQAKLWLKKVCRHECPLPGLADDARALAADVLWQLESEKRMRLYGSERLRVSI